LKETSDDIDLTKEEVLRLLKELVKDGEIRRDEKGRYYVTEKGLMNYGFDDN
jgi:predicted transcriptional regulator